MKVTLEVSKEVYEAAQRIAPKYGETPEETLSSLLTAGYVEFLVKRQLTGESLAEFNRATEAVISAMLTAEHSDKN